MSYLVLARKHRPATFDQVVGQDHVTRTLAGALASGRLAHAFMFTGPRGVGKTSVARILAKALNCDSGPTAEPCGQCTACKEIDAGTSLDVQEIDAASNSSVEDVRELREVIRYRPQAARYRVTILDEVHMLSKAAFNALLKTLEEPPEHAIFILATTDAHKVPLTILSRCQRYDFRRLPPRLLAEHLGNVLAAEGCKLPLESLSLMAREADGSVRDALSLLDQVLSLGRDELSHAEVVELLGLVDRELVAACADQVLAGDAGQVLDIVGQVYGAGGEMQAFYGALQEEFRNLAAAKAAPRGMDLFGLTDEEVTGLRARGEAHSAETLHEVFDILARSEELFRRASQPRLVLEMTLLRLTQVKPVLSLDDVIARLAQAAPDAPSGQTTAPPAAAPPPAAPPGAPASPQGAPPTAAPNSAPTQASPPVRSNGGIPGSPAAALKELVDYASRESPLLASQLGRGQAIMDGQALKVTLPPGPMSAQVCGQDNRDRLGSLACELWGAGATVSVTAEPADNTPAPTPRADEAAKASALAEHPAVAEAMDVFEAQVVSLKPTDQ